MYIKLVFLLGPHVQAFFPVLQPAFAATHDIRVVKEVDPNEKKKRWHPSDSMYEWKNISGVIKG
jgi:hypothetical protein